MIWRGQMNVERTIVFLSGGLFVGEEHQQRQEPTSLQVMTTLLLS
jgi:hypothetical protein